jgi:hypothetical protein
VYVCVCVCVRVCVCGWVSVRVCVCCVRAGGWPDSLSFLCAKERVFLVCPKQQQRSFPKAFSCAVTARGLSEA